VPRKPTKKGPKTLYVHHKQQGLLPQSAFEQYTIKSTFQKAEGPIIQGDATRTMVAYARQKMKEGMTAKAAAKNTAEYVRSGLRQRGKDDSLKMFDRTKETKHRKKDKPGQGLIRKILSELRKKRADRSPP
jgi:hypothetical protein